ncbi:MMPL family transporter [Tumebacillus algifaecis]|uniref:MMPL family transporter n=1 Tax=Tumebacillus algifaecis TaxID=1214604 RepID=UPI00155F5EEE|nr:MMPL family transporter [Tumebacillus algifaecis]
MIETWIRGLAKARWFVVLLWVALVAGSVFVMPDLGKIVAETESAFVPSDAESEQAKQLLEQISQDDQAKSSAIVVMHRDGGLTANDRDWLKGKWEELIRDKSALGIENTQTAYEEPSLADKFESKDKTTQMLLVGFPREGQAEVTQTSIDLLRERLSEVPEGAQAYVTGGAAIMKDYMTTSKDGLRKTEFLTIGLVLAILLVVFRSPIAPFVPLLTIGLSFILSRGLVALATEFGMPVSSFTETFLVAVLFGAGTDYCILLIHRFREELSNGLDRVDALVKTMKTVGKTVIFSASTVLIGFFMIGFAKFGLYQSAVGVAIGMAATLIAGLTLTPALMMILGPKMYWPFQIKPGQGHGDSKLWGGMASLVSRKPLLVLLITVIILAPLTLLFQNERSFDEIAEIDPEIGSVKGFRTIENAFSSGEMFPVTVAITSDESMRNAESLAALEKISANASQVPNVKEVRSAARPLGEQLEELVLSKQLNQVNDALGEMRSGVRELKDGLSEASSGLTNGQGDIVKLEDGLGTIASKQTEIAKGTEQIAQGLKQGAQQIQAGLPQLQELGGGLGKLQASSTEMQRGLQQINGGLQQTKDGLNGAVNGLGTLQQTTASMSADLQQLLQNYPQLANDPAFLSLQGKQQGVTQGLSESQKGLAQIDPGMKQFVDGTGEIANGLGQIAAAQGQMQKGVQALPAQMGQLAQGLNQSVSALNLIKDGQTQLADGTKQAGGGVGELKSGLNDLNKGLGEGTNALGQIADGLTQVKDAQTGMVENGAKQIDGWYLPPEMVAENDDLKKAFDSYLSPDGKVAKLEVVLAINPYSNDAINMLDQIRSAIEQGAYGTALKNPQIKFTGTTAQYSELSGISKADFIRTGALILIGIYIVLALLLRSVLAPIYLLVSLAFSYLVTMGIIEWIFVDLLGQPGLSWTVSFFAFMLLVALGVDYSIFLMARFREEYLHSQDVMTSMKRAMTTTGGVIISAAVIMGGTFAALVFSGVASMVQIGATVLLGLILYTTIVMGLIVPATAILFGEANWWPLKRSKKSSVPKEEAVQY